MEKTPRYLRIIKRDATDLVSNHGILALVLEHPSQNGERAGVSDLAKDVGELVLE